MMQKKKKITYHFLLHFAHCHAGKQTTTKKTAIPTLFSISLCFRQQYVMQKKRETNTQQRAFLLIFQIKKLQTMGN
jgi:hypothetical protein